LWHKVIIFKTTYKTGADIMEFKRILVTSDLSDNSAAAFPFALEQARLHSGEIIVLGVFEEFDIPALLQRQIPNPEAVTAMRKEYREDLKNKLGELVAKNFAGCTARAELIISMKSPAAEITAFSEQNNCNLIVMASRGRGAIGSLVLGSVAQRVIREAKVPVLVIPKHAGEQAKA